MEMTSLRDEQAFPRFMKCPDENDIPDFYYGQRADGIYAPVRHWCFLGEITEKGVFNRLCLRVRDREGVVVSANFHLDSSGCGMRVFTPGMSNFPTHPNVPEPLVKEGSTIAILYGNQHSFMDGSEGFRIEVADSVQVETLCFSGGSFIEVTGLLVLSL